MSRHSIQRKRLRRFLFPLFALVLVYLWIAYIPFIPHRPWCEISSYEFATKLKEDYISLINEAITKSDDEKSRQLGLGSSGYSLVVGNRLFLTYADAQGDLVSNTMRKNAPLLLQNNSGNVAIVKLFEKWTQDRESYFSPNRSDTDIAVFENVQCEILHEVSQK